MLLLLSLGLHFFTIVLYIRLPLKLAAITIYPIWVWGAIGLTLSSICFLFFKTRGSLALILIWTFTVLLLADEARPLSRLGVEPLAEAPAPPHAGTRVLRVVTLNCEYKADPIKAMGDFEPDVIFLQEMPPAYRIKQLIDQVFEGKGDYRYDLRKHCAIIVRGTIHNEFRFPNYRSQLITAEMLNGRKLNLLNVHLISAATNMKLYRRDCWREHIQNRTLRQFEMAYSLAGLKQYTSYPQFPAIVAGDFNAPANDAVHRMMEKEFTDAFAAVGTGWGNTYHRSLPLLRIDHIYSSDKLIPVRSRTFRRDESDHRMVVADFIFR